MSAQALDLAKQHLDVECLRRLEPLGVLSAGRLEELLGLCSTETAARGTNPFRAMGLGGQSVYLLSGELKLDFDDGSSSVMVGGSEAARLPLGRRTRSVAQGKAITDVGLLRIDDETVDIMMTWDQLAARVEMPVAPMTPAEAPDWRLMSGAFRLQNLTDGALSRLPPASIDALFRRFERVRAGAGETILRQGDEGDYYYIIESGRAEVLRKVGGVDMLLAELKAGDAFGEEALVADSRRNASVTMRSAGALLRLGKQDFIELLREPLLKRLSPEAAKTSVQDGALWLDVRYPAEYQMDRLPGAINLPLNELRDAIGLLDRDKNYVVYCQSGRRSSAAAFLLSQRGYRASWLEGGLHSINAGKASD